ncbi:MAG TPA: DAK2 domain-containing protein [Candidatus Gallimonas gallistercoris]|uniref:DAK2 domain-containing protein n=1 Tax=Candidatus Gallimonas gallistercoris TaxID=2838602 RepID=A0A9D2H152_9FIRM|nr:DAK2 domain-containing protein [Candidatus Gallimonas gallistercoris]
MQKTINCATFRKMVLVGAKMLENNRAKVDALNVFPVPDGDTGTNMSLTMQSAVKELSTTSSNTFMEVCDCVSKGALRGARGNSGVILSQIFRGICTVLRVSKPEVDTRTFAKAMEQGTKVAYNAVSIPKEGTILTVVRLMSEFAVKVAGKYKDFETFIPAVIAEGDRALAMTPELLPVLKKAGVVDSGGVGLMTIMRGFQAAIMGEEIASEVQTEAVQQQTEADFGDNSDIISMDLGDIQFAYCTEFFVINLKKSTTLADIDKLRENLMNIGDSVICIGDLEMIKVHVHTNSPGVALTYALELGELDRPKIENMLEQNRALKAKIEAEKKDQGMLAICAGEGIRDIFKDLFVDRVIEGGQTMNPSASDIATAVQKINAENVFVFPNNKNIILAAEQAKALVDNRTIHVIPTKNVPQGFAAALSFSPEASLEENKTNMIHALDNVKAGQVTHAVRTTNVNGFSITEGDIIGLDDKKILAKSNSIDETVLSLLEKLKEDQHEVITLYYGEGVTEEDAKALSEKVQEAFPDCDVDYHFGGQPVYYYLLSLE